MQDTEIILTLDRAAMSDYQNNINLGYVSCVPDRVMPRSIYHRYFVPKVPVSRRGDVVTAPLPIRALEAILLNGGFERNQIAVIRTDFLEKRVNESTKVVGLSSHDPLGVGPVTTTIATVLGGQPRNRLEFEEQMLRIRRLKRKYNFKVVLGGTGAWQLLHENSFRSYGIDYLYIGEAEYEAPGLFHELVGGDHDGPRVVYGSITKPRNIPIIVRATNWNLVELTRGCGRGCLHCSPNTSGKLRSVPIDIIIENAKVNLQSPYNTYKAIFLQSDDALRYGSSRRDGRLDPDSLYQLYDALFELGARTVQFTHASFANLVADEDFIIEFTRYLKAHGMPGAGCQPGLETGSIRLMSKLMHGKMRPYSPEEWPWVVQNGLRIMSENDWTPACTLILGLPGEAREDILDTYRLIKSVRKYKSLYVPLFFAPIGMTRLHDAKMFISEYMTKEQWKLLRLCWMHNLEHLYDLYDSTDFKSPATLKVLIKFGTYLMAAFLKTQGDRKINDSRRARALKDLKDPDSLPSPSESHGCEPDVCLKPDS